MIWMEQHRITDLVELLEMPCAQKLVDLLRNLLADPRLLTVTSLRTTIVSNQLLGLAARRDVVVKIREHFCGLAVHVALVQDALKD